MGQPGFHVRIVLIVLATVFGACQAKHPGETKSSTSAAPANSESRPAPAERPSLVARIDNVSMYPVPNHREDLAVSLVVAVGNSGTPSVVQDWSLEVTGPSRRVSLTAAPVHVNGMVEMPGSAGKKVDIGKEDLALKTARAPIAKDTHVNGILTFVLPRTAESELANNGSGFTLHFKDSQGNSYLTRKGLIGGKSKSK
jgi:hypothetical protein